MSVTDVPVDRLDALETKIDVLAEQMTVLAAEAEHRRRQRESFEDLTGDLNRISGDAMAVATRELETLSQTADLADTLRLLRRLVEVAPTLERALVGLNTASSFVDDVVPLGSDVMAMATERLDELERKGYFRMAGAAAGVADRVVTNFDERDVEQLGDNIVTMLEALREVTQPEMLAFLTRMIDAVQAEQQAVEMEAAEPPSLWALVSQVRDPDVRRGMARALHTLRAVSVETGPRAATAPGDRTRSTSSLAPTPPLEGENT